MCGERLGEGVWGGVGEGRVGRGWGEGLERASKNLGLFALKPLFERSRLMYPRA